MSNYLIDARLTERKVNEKAKEGGEIGDQGDLGEGRNGIRGKDGR